MSTRAMELARPASKNFVNLRSTIGTAAVVMLAAGPALMLALMYELELHAGMAVVFGVAVLAAGVAYTILSFLRGPVECGTHRDDQEI